DPGDVLVLNNSGRMPGVLKGRAENDGQVDMRFAALKSRGLASCRIYPDHAIKVGGRIKVNGREAFRVVTGPYGLNAIYDVEATANAVNRAKSEGRRVAACGSTVLRTLETAAESPGRVRPMEGISKLYIRPGYEFKIMDRYFTNFHVWRSSLMVLDAAVCGFPFVRKVYAHG